MATHVVNGDDGERMYLNDDEYKRYKSQCKRRQRRRGCLSVIGTVIFILVLLYLKMKEEAARDKAAQEQPSIQFTEDSNS